MYNRYGPQDWEDTVLLPRKSPILQRRGDKRDPLYWALSILGIALLLGSLFW